MLTPEPAFSEPTDRAYTALRVSGIVSHSLAHNWNKANPGEAIAIRDLLRSIGSEAIAEITHRYDNQFTDMERLNVEHLLCSANFDATFRTKAVS
jgi:hypothetical protein